MTHHLNTRDGGDAGSGRPGSTDRERPFTDREVPIEGTRMSEVMQAWLDGDLPEDAVLDAGAATPRQINVWHRVDQETARLRGVKAPARLVQAVMRGVGSG